MLEIKNNRKHVTQVIVRSLMKPNSFTCLNIPGVGKGKNYKVIDEERSTDYVEKLKKDGTISTRIINKLKGEK